METNFLLIGPFLQSQNRPFSEVFMLVSSFFCRSVATNHQIAVVSFAEIGHFSGQVKNGISSFLVSINHEETWFL